MSMVWVYPASLLWVTEYKPDWLRGTQKPGGFIEFLCCQGLYWGVNWTPRTRRVSLWVWQLAFIGFLMVSDSTYFALHMNLSNLFSAALFVHAVASIRAQRSERRRVLAQTCVMCFATL